MPYLHETNITFAGFRWLGYLMAFLGGAINAGGFFAVLRYTSHMSGELARLADTLYVGDWEIAITACLMVVSFILGATHSSWTILWAKRQRFRSSYGISMWLEAIYMLIFGLMGAWLGKWGSTFFLSPTIMLMCFIMGMHNTVMTVLSSGVIRSTHMTGFVTDIGIELSKVLYYRRDTNPRLPDVQVNIPKIKLFSGVITSFVVGGIVGAWGFHVLGYHFVMPVAAILFVLGFGSIGYDVRLRFRIWLYRRHRRQRAARREKEKTDEPR
ncbi:MAG: YoaK family protein [Neisseria sp.]|nr:YoaK family protein [Neisseria sp.]